MSRVFHKVPPLKQDLPENCWYWGAKMVIEHHKGKGTMRPFHELEAARKAAGAGGFDTIWCYDDMKTFLKIAGLTPCPPVARQSVRTPQGLGAYLSSHGPLWAGGKFGTGQRGHVIVITGIGFGQNKCTVDYNDPGYGIAQQMTFEQFVDRLYLWDFDVALAHYQRTAGSS